MGTGSVKDSVMATGIIRSPYLPSPSTGLDPALTISSGSQQAQSSVPVSPGFLVSLLHQLIGLLLALVRHGHALHIPVVPESDEGVG